MHLWGHNLMVDRKAWLSVSTLIHPKDVLSGWGQDSVQASQVHPHQTLSSCLYGPALCTGAQSCWNRKGPSPNCSYKVGSMELSNISWCAEAFKVPFTGTKGPSPGPGKQPHAIIPPPPNFTQRSQARTVLLATTKPRLVHQSARWRSSIRQSREHVSTALESSGCVLYTTASNALHCTCWCMVWMQLLSHGKPSHEALYALF